MKQIQSFIKVFSKNIIKLNRYTKRLIAIIFDTSLCIILTWIAFFLKLEDINFIMNYNFKTAAIISIIAIPIFWISGLYRTLFRYASLSIISTITLATFIYGILFFSIISIYQIQSVPRSIGVLQPILLFLAIVGSRFLIKFLLTGTFSQLDNIKNKTNILIYGAGSAGQQSLLSLENYSQYKVVGFLDDNPQLHRQILLGQKIYNPKMIENLKETKDVKIILLAIPSIGKLKKYKIIKNLTKYQLPLKSLPNLDDIIDGKISVSDIKDFLVEDLLDRDEIEPDKKLLQKNIKNKTVLVTGAGGTIGSELCQQIIKLAPQKLILLELNEYALYNIYEHLIKINTSLEIIPLLSNIQEQSNFEKILKTFKVDTIYHTAAYKHVPLVESNICEGVKNNVFGTLRVAKASINQNVKNLVLISSDKAVRPTNIMGASKRFAELCMQGLYQTTNSMDINFSIVRFGNVINSSGSVIPRFKEQIKMGGPITLTHPDVTRYFMTISEASQLVIQAGALGKNSEVFVLNMGKSIKILDLIGRMVNLSGLTLKNQNNKDGDLDVKITGLRPGEKLYEELLIGNNPKKTIHPKIYKTDEPFISYSELEKILDQLLDLLNNQQPFKVKKLLENSIRLYQSSSEIVDYLHIEGETSKNKKKDLTFEEEKNNVVNIK